MWFADKAKMRMEIPLAIQKWSKHVAFYAKDAINVENAVDFCAVYEKKLIFVTNFKSNY